MGEKPRSRLADLREKARALLSLPDCAMREVLSGIGLSDREDKEYRAQHEAGHALAYLLGGKPMKKAAIHRLHGGTCARLNTLMGKDIFIAGEVSIGESEEEEYAQQHPDRNALVYLAGFAATQDASHDRFFSHVIRKKLPEGENGSWEDISVPYVYIRDRFEAIHQRIPTTQEVSSIFYDVLEELKSIFSEDEFASALVLIKKLIMGHGLKVNINDTITKALRTSGFSLEKIAEMQQRLYAIDIDRVVQRHGRAAL